MFVILCLFCWTKFLSCTYSERFSNLTTPNIHIFIAHQTFKKKMWSFILMHTSSPSCISPREHASKHLLYQLLSLSFVCFISTYKTFEKPRRYLNFTFFRYLDNWFRELPIPRECIFGWDHMWMPNNEVGVCVLGTLDDATRQV